MAEAVFSTGVVVKQYLSFSAWGGSVVLQLELTQDGCGCLATAVSSDAAACGKRRTLVWCLFRPIMNEQKFHTSLWPYSMCDLKQKRTPTVCVYWDTSTEQTFLTLQGYSRDQPLRKRMTFKAMISLCRQHLKSSPLAYKRTVESLRCTLLASNAYTNIHPERACYWRANSAISWNIGELFTPSLCVYLIDQSSCPN